mgnify:CR=1 FL=1
MTRKILVVTHGGRQEAVAGLREAVETGVPPQPAAQPVRRQQAAINHLERQRRQRALFV